MKKSLLALILSFLPLVGVAQDSYWKGPSGEPIPDSASRRTVDGFAGWLLATSDEDWEKKWNTPPEVTPSFNEAHSVNVGQRIFILIFFASAGLGPEQEADVRCDIKITRPNNTVSIDQKGAACFKGRIAGNPNNMYLSAPVIGFIGETADPKGIWIVDVVLRDEVRNVQVPLKTEFMLN